jgi:hypothetical protein
MSARDERLQKMVERRANKEVLAWLRSAPPGEEHTLGTLVSTTSSIGLANQLYERGAEQVLAFEIKRYDQGENTGKLIIKLPSDAPKRRDIFAWCAKWAESLGFEPTVDEGQPYLFVMLD